MKKLLTVLMMFTVLMAGAVQAQNMMNTKHYRSHFIYMTSLGFNSGVGKLHFENRTLQNKILQFNVNQMVAYQFNPYVSLGIELGVDIWKRTAFVPLTANLMVSFMDGVATPIWYVNAGYAFKWYVSSQPEKMDRVIHGAKDGWHVNTGFGARVQILPRLHLLLAADYKMQYTTLQYSVTDPTATFDYSLITTNRSVNKFYHFIGVKVGLLYW